MKRLLSADLFFKGPNPKGGYSDKEYHVWVEKHPEGCVVGYSYGPRGGTLRSGTKTPKDKFVEREEAQRLFHKIVDEQVTQGYKLQSSDPATEQYTIPTNGKPRHADFSPLLLDDLTDIRIAAARVIDEDYALEEKYDGKRIALICERSGVTALNRRSIECGIHPDIVAASQALVNRCGPLMLDGEAMGAMYYAFDLLMTDGADIRRQPLSERLALRNKLIKNNGAAIRNVVTTTEKNMKAVMVRKLFHSGAEGAVLKRLSAPYRGGRQKDEFKLKWTHDASFIVLGLNTGQGRNSVELGCYDAKGKLVPTGNCSMRDASFSRLKEGMILDVRYLHVFPDTHHVYQGRMLKIRDDVPAKDCLLSRLHYKGALRPEGVAAGL